MPEELRANAASILVVEDEQLITSKLVEAVRNGGWKLAGPAASLSQAHDILSREPVAAAVLDFIVDGEYVDPLAQELRTRGIPFAITTGIGGREAAKRFEAPIIIKPFQNVYVTDVLGRLLKD